MLRAEPMRDIKFFSLGTGKATELQGDESDRGS